MKTYTVEITCDNCHHETIAGPAMRTVEEADEAAIKEAERWKWRFLKDQWVCVTCIEDRSSCQNPL